MNLPKKSKNEFCFLDLTTQTRIHMYTISSLDELTDNSTSSGHPT